MRSCGLILPELHPDSQDPPKEAGQCRATAAMFIIAKYMRAVVDGMTAFQMKSTGERA